MFAIITILSLNLALHCYSRGLWVSLLGKLSAVELKAGGWRIIQTLTEEKNKAGIHPLLIGGMSTAPAETRCLSPGSRASPGPPTQGWRFSLPTHKLTFLTSAILNHGCTLESLGQLFKFLIARTKIRPIKSGSLIQAFTLTRYIYNFKIHLKPKALPSSPEVLPSQQGPGAVIPHIPCSQGYHLLTRQVWWRKVRGWKFSLETPILIHLTSFPPTSENAEMEINRAPTWEPISSTPFVLCLVRFSSSFSIFQSLSLSSFSAYK